MRQQRPDLPVLAIQTLSGVINTRLLSERLLAMLGTFFAAVALALAAVGVYDLLANLVARQIPKMAACTHRTGRSSGRDGVDDGWWRASCSWQRER